MSPRATIWRSAVGHLDADGLLAGDGRQDAHVGRRHGVGDVLVQAGDPVDLDAGAELELVAGDGGADHHADQPGLHAVLGQRLLEGAAGVLDARRSTWWAPARSSSVSGGSFHGEALAAGPSAISSCSGSTSSGSGTTNLGALRALGPGRLRAVGRVVRRLDQRVVVGDEGRVDDVGRAGPSS